MIGVNKSGEPSSLTMLLQGSRLSYVGPHHGCFCCLIQLVYVILSSEPDHDCLGVTLSRCYLENLKQQRKRLATELWKRPVSVHTWHKNWFLCLINDPPPYRKTCRERDIHSTPSSYSLNQ